MTAPADRTGFRASPYPAANVASVPQRSPLRYPGGKMWLIRHVKAWLRQLDPRRSLPVEPFCGGGSVSLSAVMEGWAERRLLGELDCDVAASWQAPLQHCPALVEKVRRFQVPRAAVNEFSDKTSSDVLERGSGRWRSTGPAAAAASRLAPRSRKLRAGQSRVTCRAGQLRRSLGRKLKQVGGAATGSTLPQEQVRLPRVASRVPGTALA